ncbi:chitinase [Chania multitudinisentens RB-25]|uniref:chitinase n=1 Tax=Chania multitudinisentens RB-25 TaxID=1441930 RepID=W0L7R5_9GAMM|nr:glycoside hydrolase family 18 protein [Chania multitudinisentens]AHG18297.1 chitinase [Chania multitudinisentens RB-25]
MALTRKLLPLLVAVQFGMAGAGMAQAASYLSVGYFNGGGDVTAGPGGDINKLDVTQITHLNYSFGLIYNNEKKETNPALKDSAHLHQIYLSPKVESDLKLLPVLRKQNPALKVLLSVGGWGARGFSGAAATPESRAVFIRSVQDVINKYQLDGIDLDWEYPVNGAWGLVESQPADRDNFTVLLRELHQALDKDKLLTIAVAASAKSPQEWLDVTAIAPYLNYINLMTYDMAYGTQYFNSNLYDSKQWPTVAAADKYSADFVVNNYLAAGLKPAQLNLGIGFYGRVPKRATEPGIDWDKADAAKHPVTQPYFTEHEKGIFKSLGVDLEKDTYIKYNDIVSKMLQDPQQRFSEHWDNDAKVPYLMMRSAAGKPVFAVSYENPRSVAIKADYIKGKGLGGAMFWEYGADDENRLAQTLAETLGINTLKK